MTTRRKLVSIYKIWNVEPAENADRLEVVRLGGWRCVVPKGQYNKGDLVVFFEEDAFLPLVDPRYGFLNKSCYKKNEFMGEGLLVKNRDIRGNRSEGLVLPLTEFPELEGCKEGDVVTDKLGVRKWMTADVVGSMGTIIGDKPGWIQKSDEIRVKSEPSLIDALTGLPYYISEKLDGTSMSVWRRNGEEGVSGRTKQFKNDGKSSMWKTIQKYNLFEKWEKDNWEGWLQAEFCGEKIQGNPMGLFGVDFFVYNVFTPNGELYSLDDMLAFCERYGLKSVKILETGDSFNYDLTQLEEKARGNYDNGKPREGIVIRPQIPVYNDILKKSLSFKIISKDYPTYRD